MNYFAKNKVFTIALAILLIANIATIIVFWTMKATPPPPPNLPQQPAPPASFLTKELNFTSAQQKQFEQLRNEHQQQVRSIRDSIRVAKDLFFGLMNNDKVSDEDLQDAAAKAGNYQQQLDIITFKHFQKVKAICTPTQEQHFDKIIQQVIRQIAPRPDRDGRRPGPPPGGQEPGEPDEHGGPPPPPQ
jgi:Spy/CpxP family protein refolding chaperone